MEIASDIGNRISQNFRRGSDSQLIENVVEYVETFLQDNPDAEIHIGTDSQQKGGVTVYATVIAFRYNPFSARGVHYIYSKVKLPRVRDFFERLYNETLYSLHIAQLVKPVTDSHTIEIEIDMDYNSDRNHKSYKLVSATTGFASALGYKVNIKPHNQIATRAADHRCKS